VSDRLIKLIFLIPIICMTIQNAS